MNIVALVLMLFLSGFATAQTPDQLNAFNAGKTAGGNSNTQGIFDSITHSQAGNTVSGYSQTPPPQSSYWGGANSVIGPIYSGGNSKISECGTGTTSTAAQDQQHCEAVNSIMKTQADMPTNLVTRTDPLTLQGQAISANPDSIAGAIGGSYSNCTTEQQTNNSPFTMQTCDEWSETGTSTCTIGQNVVVDPDYIYRCKETISTINSGTCSYGNVVVVDADYNYQCESNVQTKITQSCQKIAVLSVDSSSTWGGAGQLLLNPNVYRGIYARIYANSTPNTYTMCFYSIYVSGQNCDSNVYSGKSFTIVGTGNLRYNALIGSLSCNGTTCTWSGYGNLGCYGVPGCQWTARYFNFTFAAPTSTVQVKKISWQDNCTALEAAAR